MDGEWGVGVEGTGWGTGDGDGGWRERLGGWMDSDGGLSLLGVGTTCKQIG